MRAISISLLFLLAGCSPQVKSVTYPLGVPIQVTSGYAPPHHHEGNEFVFSIVLPDGDVWSYPDRYPTTHDGYIRTAGKRSMQELLIEWIWISRDLPGTQNALKERPYILPWYTGVRAEVRRIPYSPTERQLTSGDWYSVGYPQQQFYQAVFRGRHNYYCIRSVFRRGGRSTWDQERGAPQGASYSVYDTCPFRTTDGRDAYFKISTGFWISAEDFDSNPDAFESRLTALDEFLKPSWDSLVVMPQAYQFEKPLTAASLPQEYKPGAAVNPIE